MVASELVANVTLRAAPVSSCELRAQFGTGVPQGRRESLSRDREDKSLGALPSPKGMTFTETYRPKMMGVISIILFKNFSVSQAYCDICTNPLKVIFTFGNHIM